jgi:hypothetical protein
MSCNSILLNSVVLSRCSKFKGKEKKYIFIRHIIKQLTLLFYITITQSCQHTKNWFFNIAKCGGFKLFGLFFHRQLNLNDKGRRMDDQKCIISNSSVLQKTHQAIGPSFNCSHLYPWWVMLWPVLLCVTHKVGLRPKVRTLIG